MKYNFYLLLGQKHPSNFQSRTALTLAVLGLGLGICCSASADDVPYRRWQSHIGLGLGASMRLTTSTASVTLDSIPVSADPSAGSDYSAAGVSLYFSVFRPLSHFDGNDNGTFLRLDGQGFLGVSSDGNLTENLNINFEIIRKMGLFAIGGGLAATTNRHFDQSPLPEALGGTESASAQMLAGIMTIMRPSPGDPHQTVIQVNGAFRLKRVENDPTLVSNYLAEYGLGGSLTRDNLRDGTYLLTHLYCGNGNSFDPGPSRLNCHGDIAVAVTRCLEINASGDIVSSDHWSANSFVLGIGLPEVCIAGSSDPAVNPGNNGPSIEP